MFKSAATFLTATLLSLGLIAEEVVVVVHPSNTNEITVGEASRIFSGRNRTFSDGEPASPLILPNNHRATGVFNQKVFGRNTTQLNSQISRRIFTTRGSPSKTVDDEAMMLELISQNPDMVGYLPVKFLDESVRVALKL